MSTRKVHTQHPLASHKNRKTESPYVSADSSSLQRIDSAHPSPQGINLPTGQEGIGEELAVDVNQAADDAAEFESKGELPKVDAAANLHWQAAQLGEQLQKRQDELNRRRDDFHADLTRFEAEQRNVRAELVDRERLATAREEELDQRARSLAEQLAAAAAAEAHADREHIRFAAVLAEREAVAARWEEKLKQQQESLVAQQRALVESARRWQTQRDEMVATEERKCVAERQQLANLQSGLQKSLRLIERKSKHLEEQQRRVALQQQEAASTAQALAGEEISQRLLQLEMAEKLVDKRQAELEQQKIDLQQQKSAFINTQKQQQVRAERETAKREKIWAERVASLDAWEQTLSNRYEAAQQMRDDALELQREGLEMRLTAEQLWSHLVDVVPADERTRAISRIRQRLADSHKFVLDDISAHREELVSLGERLEARRAKLAQQKAGLERWLNDRRAELDEEAARLTNRNQALDMREADLEEMAQRIVEERMEYEDRLRNRVRGAA